MTIMKRFTASAILLLALNGLSYGQNQSGSVSTTGSCGGESGLTCLGSTFGDCCSTKGFCGSTNDFCSPSAGCQAVFGSCQTSTSFISYDGKCGTQDPNSQVCIGSVYGSCCSQNGWCGNGTVYCGAGCQGSFGTCGGTGVTVSSGNSSSVTSSSSASTTKAQSTAATSQTSSAVPAAQTDSVTSQLQSAKSSLQATQIGLGVVAAFFAVALGVIAWLLFRRRAAKNTPKEQVYEKEEGATASSATSQTPSSRPETMSAATEAPPYASIPIVGVQKYPMPSSVYEIGPADNRAELTGAGKI